MRNLFLVAYLLPYLLLSTVVYADTKIETEIEVKNESTTAPTQALTLANKILVFLDKGKAEGKPFTLTMSVKDLSTGKHQKYKMKDDGNTKTILEFLNKRQRGQKILSTEKDIWFFSKRTRRAIRIPPIQKLFGDASIGDISRLKYSVDYSPVALTHENTLIKLELISTKPASTYHKIELWVTQQNYLPQKANLYATSGKQLKSARFTDVELINDIPVVNQWELFTADNEQKVTQITSADFTYIDAPSVEFTKSYLEMNK